MGKIKLALQSRSIPNKIQFGTDVETAMNVNPNFPALGPEVGAMSGSKTTLQTKWTEYNGALQLSQQKLTEVQSAEADFDKEMTQLANDVENESDGDVAKIQSAAMDVRNPASPPQIPEQVLNLKAGENDNSGAIDLSWKKVDAAKSYNVEMTTDIGNLSSFAFKATSTKTKITISGLVSGTKYWFRVYAVGAAGNGATSDPAVKYAP